MDLFINFIIRSAIWIYPRYRPAETADTFTDLPSSSSSKIYAFISVSGADEPHTTQTATPHPHPSDSEEGRRHTEDIEAGLQALSLVKKYRAAVIADPTTPASTSLTADAVTTLIPAYTESRPYAASKVGPHSLSQYVHRLSYLRVAIMLTSVFGFCSDPSRARKIRHSSYGVYQYR